MAAEEPLGDSVLRLSTDEKALLEGIKRGKVAASGLQNHFNDTASAINQAMATIGIGLSLNAFLEATIAAEKEQALLAAAVKATGGAAGFTAAQLNAQASALQSLTGISDESIQQAERAMMAFGNVQGQVFKDGIAAALDLAAATGKDAASAAHTLGMALQNPAEGMDRLKRSGVALSGSTRALILDLEEQGDLLGAQKVLLGAVEQAYGGAARAARNTLGGALANLKNVIEDNVLEIKGPFLDGLREAAEVLARAVPGAVRVLSASFVLLQEAIGGAMQFVFLQVDTLVKLLNRDFRGAWESYKESFANLNPKDWGDAAVAAFKSVGVEQDKLAKETASLAAEAGNAAGAYDLLGQRGTAAMDQAAAAAQKAKDAVATAVTGLTVDVNASYDELVAKAQEASFRASQAAMLAAESARIGLVSQAESAKRLAEGYGREAEGFAQKAIAAQQRLQAATLGLKTSTAQNVGELMGLFARGAVSFEDFSRRVIVAIAKMIAQMAILRAFGAGTVGGALGGGLVTGLLSGFAEGGDVQGGKPIIVGEKGPELYVPRSSGTIVPNNKLGGGGASVNVNLGGIQGVDLGSVDGARRILRTAAALVRAGVAEGLALTQAVGDQQTLQAGRAY